VWAEEITDFRDYEENGLNVKRVWKRGSLSSLIQLIFHIWHTPEKLWLVSFEAYMFGSIFQAGVFLVGMIGARLSGKKVIILLHQLPSSMEGLNKETLFSPLLLMLFYRLVDLASDRILVFEEALLDRLVSKEKGRVLPHLVPRVELVDKRMARQRLGWNLKKKYILCFGYIAPYKGIEELLNFWPEDEDILVIAGGMNPNHKDNPEMLKYIAKIEELAKKKKAIVTGFVREDEVRWYFGGCDGVILPYLTFMSSSGPLSLAMAYEKPVLLRQSLTPYFESVDLRRALDEAELTLEDMLFDDATLAMKLKQSDDKVDRKVLFARLVKEQRDLEGIARKLSQYLKEVDYA
jgi:glycosyltransferase involved in cell wall biosynthesis